MGEGRDCEMVERAENAKKKTCCSQEQEAGQIETNSPNEDLSRSGGKQKHKAFTIWRYGRVGENHHEIDKHQYYRGVSVEIMFYFWPVQIHSLTDLLFHLYWKLKDS